MRFELNQYMIKAAEARCKELTKNGLSFAFQKWQEQWTEYIALKGGYFEKDHVRLDK